jgi:phthalate 4,5-dioxygenase oxygenase subunit
VATTTTHEALTQVGPGTVMGDLMRQYWIPAALSSELEPDGDPMRLVLLGEPLSAFRDSSGRVGVMDHRCPHRCASLFLGRNEANGIRCIYHGWKFDAAGNCVDMPNVSPSRDFKAKVKARAYKVAERNGLIWVYMGPRAVAPPLPMIESNLLPECDVNLTFVQRECNWLQALEGDIDTSHFGFLHFGNVELDDLTEDDPMRYTVGNRAPDYHVAETPWGTTYCAYRPANVGQTYWRFANFLFPFWTQQPQGRFPVHVHVRAWVPLDDTHTMFINVFWKQGMSGSRTLKDGRPWPGAKRDFDYVPNTTDWHGRWRLAHNASNDWGMDREAQRRGAIYSGIDGIHLQDQAVTESMGPIVDHTFEHLSPSDQMITRTRRRLLRAARDLHEKGVVPPGIDDPEAFLGARSGYFITDERADWQAAYAEQVKTMTRAAAQPQVVT